MEKRRVFCVISSAHHELAPVIRNMLFLAYILKSPIKHGRIVLTIQHFQLQMMKIFKFHIMKKFKFHIMKN